MGIELSEEQTRKLRLKAQHLGPDEAAERLSPDALLERLVAVQAQETPSALLSLRARSPGLTAAGVRSALEAEGSLLLAWSLRGTLHLLASEDARWLLPLLGSFFISGDRQRFKQLGWNEGSYAEASQLVLALMEEQGGLTRPELIALLARGGFPSTGQAPVHFLFRLALEGQVCIGPPRDGQQQYLLLKDWLGNLQPLDEAVAVEKLARRYLRAYAPATPQDFAAWSGLKIKRARAAWESLAEELIEVQAAGQTAWTPVSHLPWLDSAPSSEPAVRLLPRYDTYLLGYASRELVVAPAYARAVHPGGGIIQSVLLVDGRAAGLWKSKRCQHRLEIHIQLFERLSRHASELAELEAQDIGRFLEEDAVLVIEDVLEG